MVVLSVGEYLLLDWRQQNVVSVMVLVVQSGVLFVAGVLRVRDGFGPARSYLAAVTIFFSSLLVDGLATQGLMPFAGPGDVVHFGLVLEALVLSRALAEGTRRRNARIDGTRDDGHRVAGRDVT